MVFPVCVSIIYSPVIAVNTKQHLLNIHISSSTFSHSFMLHSCAEQWSQQRLSSLLLWRVSFREKLQFAAASLHVHQLPTATTWSAFRWSSACDLNKMIWLGMLERKCWICESQKEMFIIQLVNLFLSEIGQKDVTSHTGIECDNTALQLLTFLKSN